MIGLIKLKKKQNIKNKIISRRRDNLNNLLKDLRDTLDPGYFSLLRCHGCNEEWSRKIPKPVDCKRALILIHKIRRNVQRGK